MFAAQCRISQQRNKEIEMLAIFSFNYHLSIPCTTTVFNYAVAFMFIGYRSQREEGNAPYKDVGGCLDMQICFIKKILIGTLVSSIHN